jgi:hypothetical protein
MSPFDPKMDAAFREYADLQLRHHDLLVEGKASAPETSAVEDRMDALWGTLDDTQRRSLSGMRSDLNWAQRRGEPAPKGRKAPEEVAREEQQELVAAIGLKEWHRILHYLRLCAPLYPIAALAQLRGSAYEAIGLPTYASIFYKQASNPTR